jgi:hypothetical protein
MLATVAFITGWAILMIALGQRWKAGRPRRR